MQLDIPWISWALIVLGFCLFLASSCIFYVILGEVNGKREERNRFGMFFVSAKAAEIVRLHREFYPESGKRTLMWVMGLIGAALFIGALVANLHFVSPDQLGDHRTSN